jgi:hypothetical protein
MLSISSHRVVRDIFVAALGVQKSWLHAAARYPRMVALGYPLAMLVMNVTQHVHAPLTTIMHGAALHRNCHVMEA